MRKLSLLLLLGALPALADTTVLTLDPVQTLRVYFSTFPDRWNENNRPNSLWFNPWGSWSFPADASYTAHLYDGNTLLGSSSTVKPGDTGSGGMTIFAFNQNSSGNFFDGPVVDFTSILNGSIDGRIDFSIPAGHLDVWVDLSPFSQNPGVNLYKGASGNLLWARVTSVEVVSDASGVPEPGTFSAAGVLLFGGVVLLRRRQRAHASVELRALVPAEWCASDLPLGAWAGPPLTRRVPLDPAPPPRV